MPREKNERGINVFDGKSVLITGGTGSFGWACVRMILARSRPRRLIIFSRDEYKQHQMSQVFTLDKYDSIRFFLGDVRDRLRLNRAFMDVDFVIHAAALKQVPALEYNPFEAVLTNIQGAQNVIHAAIDQGVERVIALSTDKAVNPVNLYGATKLCAEKLFTAGNILSGRDRTRFSVVRYGNVLGSRGSVVPFFKKCRDRDGVLPITDERMTRFWFTIDDGVRFVLDRFADMHGGEIFVPKLPSMRLIELARTIAPEGEFKIIGIRPGEKIHEVLITRDEARFTWLVDDHYVICPINMDYSEVSPTARPAEPDFEFTSDKNDRWLNQAELREMIDD
jgi:UDP-N-acetylglucosamine 4,6-dehydratase